MYIENVVLGDDIKSLIFAYKKDYYFIPSRNDITPFFHEYLDYSYTYMQFGVSDKIPNTFKTNQGYKIYGPHKRELYDRIINEMSLAGRILYLNKEKIVNISENNIKIYCNGNNNEITFKNLHVYSVGDCNTDFSYVKKSRTMIYDWYSSKITYPEDSLDMVFNRNLGQIKRIMFVDNIDGTKDILAISKKKPIENDISINANIFNIYEILNEHNIDFDAEPIIRETFDISRTVISKNNKNVIAPELSMYKLLRLSSDKKSHLWSVKKAISGMRIPDSDEKARNLRKAHNLAYDSIY